MESSSFKVFVTSLSKYIVQDHPFANANWLNIFFNNQFLSDAVIRRGSQEFAVHSVVLFSHSEYFAKQLGGPWKESSGRVIDITDFDPDVVEAMITFIYYFNYEPVADTSAMIFHAQVYQIGDKYDIKALKICVAGKFRAAVESCWNTDDFPTAITLVYATTPSEDMGLRDPIVEIAFQSFESLKTQTGFCESLRNVNDFGFDPACFLYSKRRPETRRFECPNCCRSSGLSSPNHSPSYCPRCGLKDNELYIHTTVLPY